jgi:hypothetical protein
VKHSLWAVVLVGPLLLGGASLAASSSSECRDAKSDARTAALDLASTAGRLRRCAEAMDFSDDCDSEFRRVKGAHEDYEEAVQEVDSECD